MTIRREKAPLKSPYEVFSRTELSSFSMLVRMCGKEQVAMAMVRTKRISLAIWRLYIYNKTHE